MPTARAVTPPRVSQFGAEHGQLLACTGGLVGKEVGGHLSSRHRAPAVSSPQDPCANSAGSRRSCPDWGRAMVPACHASPPIPPLLVSRLPSVLISAASLTSSSALCRASARDFAQDVAWRPAQGRARTAAGRAEPARARADAPRGDTSTSPAVLHVRGDQGTAGDDGECAPCRSGTIRPCAPGTRHRSGARRDRVAPEPPQDRTRSPDKRRSIRRERVAG